MEAIKTKALLIDIRTEKEFSEGSIDGAINIPLDSIRERLSELPKDKKLALFCKSGLRSYIGQRILMQHNYDVQNLSGGYDLWKICSDGIVKKNVVAS
jgi:rhodanese-related sulfurtransferase